MLIITIKRTFLFLVFFFTISTFITTPSFAASKPSPTPILKPSPPPASHLVAIPSPALTPSPRPQIAPTPPQISTKSVSSGPSTSLPVSPKQLTQSPIAEDLSKIFYQKMTNTPGFLTGPMTTVKGLGGLSQAAPNAIAILKNAGASILDLIETIGAVAGEAGL